MARNTTPYMLADGFEVPHDSPLARWERELLAQHFDELANAGGREARAALLANIRRSCGAAYAEKLKQTYAAAHAKRKEVGHA